MMEDGKFIEVPVDDIFVPHFRRLENEEVGGLDALVLALHLRKLAVTSRQGGLLTLIDGTPMNANMLMLTLGYTAQGKTLCFDIESQGIFRRKIEEKLSKGYQTISQFDGLWSTPLSKPITQLKQGKLEGKFGMANPKGTDFRLELYRCNDGFRIDHYELGKENRKRSQG